MALMRSYAPQIITSLLLSVTLFIYFIPETFINVGPGERAVLWKRFFGGTVTEKVYGEGLQIIFPWDELYVYDVRLQETERSMTVLTDEGLMATLLVSIRFAPDKALLGLLHRDVGPEYMDKVVIPEVEATVRKAVGALSSEELYTRSRDVIQDAVVLALEETAQNYVNVDDVIIRRITLPEPVQTAIELKIEQQHVADSFVFRLRTARQEAERKRIEAQGFADYNTIISETLTDDMLIWEGVRATETIAGSDNAKVIIMGNGKEGLPVILSAE
ncbi:prohibitin family protein [Cognatishimia sp. F0-27]|uniref:prohibitin family protein n=1 Tax=Cognatishimia sp. F0-27 TaxID=2816855 RepID=UPI001D0C32D3|nr:prohibitin family protein [Cognatishimia sp. F0-27]MCC1493263.1 prohibitin family protein [Cognatishimia sp. F0-27]